MISPSFVQNHHNFSQSVSNCYWLGLTHALKPTCAISSKCGPFKFAHSEDSSYEVIEELQHIVWFNQSNLREVIVKNTEIDEFHYNNIILVHLLTQCASPATSTYVRLLYSTVYPATWPSNAVVGRVAHAE